MVLFKLESLKVQRGWVIEELDYSQFADTLLSGKEVLSGMRFLTGIYAEDCGSYALLTKVYIRVFGETVRFRIYYTEQVEAAWVKKSRGALAPEDINFLKAYNIRAAASFSAYPYSGMTPPT